MKKEVDIKLSKFKIRQGGHRMSRKIGEKAEIGFFVIIYLFLLFLFKKI